MGKKFLVVDDSVTMRRIVANSLKAIGYDNYVEAGDGREALSKLNSVYIGYTFICLITQVK